jgi:similar to spore coat protein
MNNIMRNLMGMGGMTDQMIATDFLISAKAGIRNTAFAITETATTELKAALREQLRDAIETHENITNYMISKGYYHPYDLKEQLSLDIRSSKTALELAES